MCATTAPALIKLQLQRWIFYSYSVGSSTTLQYFTFAAFAHDGILLKPRVN